MAVRKNSTGAKAAAAAAESTDLVDILVEVVDKAAEAAKSMPPPPPPVVNQQTELNPGSSAAPDSANPPPPPSTGNGQGANAAIIPDSVMWGEFLTTPINENNVESMAVLEQKRQEMFEEAKYLNEMRADLDARTQEYEKRISSDRKRASEKFHKAATVNPVTLFGSGSKTAA